MGIPTIDLHTQPLVVLCNRSVMSDSATPWIAACQASLSITNSWSILKLKSIKSVMPSNHLILCHPFLLMPSIFPNIRVYSNEGNSSLHQVAKVLQLQLQHSGLISFRTDWFDLLTIQVYFMGFDK